MQVVSLSLFRFGGTGSRVWAFAMMGGARLLLPRIAGLKFWKLCGSGTGEGFTPVPNTGVYAVLCCWDSEEIARQQMAAARVFRWYARMASESWTLFLSPITARGKWAGTMPFLVQNDTGIGPIAALTRATLKPKIALRFWNQVPDISNVIGNDPNVLFKIGIGEVPLLHQVTFSIWPDAQSMAAFARRDGPHARAIKAVRDGLWFREELYARFRITSEMGSWQGQSPVLPKFTLKEGVS